MAVYKIGSEFVFYGPSPYPDEFSINCNCTGTETNILWITVTVNDSGTPTYVINTPYSYMLCLLCNKSRELNLERALDQDTGVLILFLLMFQFHPSVYSLKAAFNLCRP